MLVGRAASRSIEYLFTPHRVSRKQNPLHLDCQTMSSQPVTLEFLGFPQKFVIDAGAAVFRLKANGLTIWLDAWIDRPANIAPLSFTTDEVTEADWILTSHAHYDRFAMVNANLDIPGADRIAKRTGATIIGNGETINVMRRAGVPESQLIPIAGTERIALGNGVAVHVFPSLHALIPTSIDHISMPDYFDVGLEQMGGLDVVPGSEEDMHVGKIPGFMGMMFSKVKNAPEEVTTANPDIKAFQTFLNDDKQFYSYFDGGQMMYAIDIEGYGRILYSSHTGCYSNILKEMMPKPDIAILGVPARANLDGYPYQGSNAEFLLEEVQWLKPKKVWFWRS
jgi:L-ascorbate metabolism protein UlaG (beta-lactamase superfamily)